ncbi:MULTISPECIES: hypothetical protein [Staphylococcus]|uniref:hypothetical protein n=1 Tax=Staphylococcus TaxID=1279 RepID=UPI0019503D8C|nr:MULTISPECIES: hypothetical protein [Staphylococcus]MCD8863884.1 hypothetical protein [Staphylococcus arlettae]
MYFKTNIDLIIFIFSRFRSVLIALIGIILFPFLITLILYWFIKNDFNLIFNYSFGVYSLVITVILFDYIIVYKRKEAKIMNSDKNLSSLISALNFIDSLMLSDKNFTHKIWKKQFAIFSDYYDEIRKNDKIYLSNNADLFKEINDELIKIESYIDLSKSKLNLEKADKQLQNECSKKLNMLIKKIDRVKERSDENG